MASKKAGGSTRNGRDSEAKRLGVKAYGNELIPAGSIIVRQHGTKFHAGDNVGMSKDHTLFAKVDGYVEFKTKGALNCKTVSIRPPSVLAGEARSQGGGGGRDQAQGSSRQGSQG